MTKECSTYIGQADGYCTVTHSNLPEFPAGAKVFYTQDQTANAAAGFLDTDVVLYAGPGNRAAGPLLARLEHEYRSVHVLGWDRALRRLQRPRRCHAVSASERGGLPLGRDV